MGRKKLTVRRIENAANRQVTYSKRKDGLVKKASELSVLCGADVALVMFSPTGRLTSFASNGRVEDILLRFVERPDEQRGGPIANEELLSERLKELKNEGELLEKISIIEGLEEKLDKLLKRRRDAQEKMRYYEPDVEKLSTALEAGVYQQFLTNAIQHVQLSKIKLLGNKLVYQAAENIEAATTLPVEDRPVPITYHSPHVNEIGMSSGKDGDEGGTMWPHLNLEFIEQAQRHWKNISNGIQIPNVDN